MRSRITILISLFLYSCSCYATLDSTFLARIENTVKNHLQYNIENDGKGNYFIYISESFNSEPTTNLSTTNWLREDPLGITPYASNIRTRLDDLNARTFIDNSINYNGKIQHYFIVVEVDLYNALKFPEYQNKLAEKKVTFEGVDSYTTFEQLVANEIKLKCKQVTFDGVFATPNTLHTTSLLVVGKKIVDNRIQAKFDFTYIGKKGETYPRLVNFWNKAIPEVNNKKGFAKLIESLDIWEREIFGTIPPGLTCPDLGLQVTSTIAADYITTRCSSLAEPNLENKKQALVDVAKFIDLLFFMKTHYANSNFANVDIGDIQTRWVPYCDVIYNAYLTNASQSFDIWFRDNYNTIENTAANNLSPKSDILRNLFVEEFFLLDQPLAGTLATDLVNSINGVASVGDWFVPVKQFFYRNYNNVFKWLKNGGYTPAEKQTVVNSLTSYNGIKNILYNDILNPTIFDPLWGELSALAISENMASVFMDVLGVPSSPKYVPIAASKNYITSKTAGINPLFIGFGIVNKPDHTFPNSNGKLDLNFDVCMYDCSGPSCLFNLIWEPCVSSLGSYKAKDLDFFEVITPVFVNNPGYFDISCNGESCEHKGYHEPAFHTMTKIRSENLNETVSDVALTVSIATLPLTGLEVAAATGIMKLIHGVWFTSEVLSVSNTIFETEIENKFKESFGNEVGTNYFEKYRRGVDLVAITSIAQLTGFQKYLASDMTDIVAAGRVSDDFLADTGGHIPGIGTNNFRALGEEVQNDLLIRIVNEAENITNKHKQWYDLAPEIDILSPSHANLRKLINRGRHLVTDADEFTPISQYLRGLSNTEIEKLVDDLDANPALIDFFTPIVNGTRSADVIQRRLRAWRIVNSVSSNSSTNITTLTKMYDDVSVNPALESFFSNNPSKFTLWDEVIAPSTVAGIQYRSSIEFINTYAITKNAARIGDPTPGSFEKHIFYGEPELTGGNITSLKGLHIVDGISESNHISFTGALVPPNQYGTVTAYSGPPPVNPANSNSGLQTAIESGTFSTNSNGSVSARVYVWGKFGNNPQVDAWRVKKTDASTGHINDFFPPSWSQQKIIEEIAFARSRLVTPGDYIQDNHWAKYSSDGQVQINMYIGQNSSSIPSLNELYGSAWAK